MTMAMSVMRELGMPEEKVLKAVTSSAAWTIGQEDHLGKLEIGGVADIAVIDYGDNPIDMSDRCGNRIKCEQGYRCLLTIANGSVVYRSCI